VGELNVLLDALIEEAALSHAGFAARVNQRGKPIGLDLCYDHASVARWIRDHAVPRGRVPEIACEILGERLNRVVTLPEAGFESAPSGRPGDPPPLRQVVSRAAAYWRSEARQPGNSQWKRVASGPAAVAPVFEWENPPDDLDVASPNVGRIVTAGEVCLVREARARYEEMYRRVGGRPVLPRVIGFLNEQAGPLLRGGYDDATGRPLMRAVGGLVAIGGICLYDTDRQAAAQRYFFDALRLAKASGDRGFGGYVVALLANQAMCLGRYRQVIQYAETAMRAARGQLSPALVSDLCTLQARAYARIGSPADCHRLMSQAEIMAGRVRVSEEPPETGYVQPGLAAVQYAEALRQLGDLSAAQSYAEQAVSTAGQCHLRGQAHRLATLAIVLAARGEAEHAAAVAARMLDHAQGMESRRIRDRAKSVTAAILACGDTMVTRELADRVDRQFAEAA
jgi:hypothetical protein